MEKSSNTLPKRNGTQMNPTALRRIAQCFLNPNRIEELVGPLGVVERDRKKVVGSLVHALIEGAGKSGRQADAYSLYRDRPEVDGVVRGSFYAWFNRPLAMLFGVLSAESLAKVGRTRPRLPKRFRLRGIQDILLFDSETLALDPSLESVFPGTTGAALKIHKLFSVGRGNIIDFTISPARDHDSLHLRLDERFRGCLLVVDLAYASFDLISKARELGIHLVIRLKDGWKPYLMGGVVESGEVEPQSGLRMEDAILTIPLDKTLPLQFDWDVEFGEAHRVPARIVGVPGDDKYHFCVTTLDRENFDPHWICDLYRCRWEIECDNKRDKTGSGLTRIEAEKVDSVLILVHASMMRTIFLNALVEDHIRLRLPEEPPIHGLALSLALTSMGGRLAEALVEDRPELWCRLAEALHARAHDPNWRGRPSRLDVQRDIVAAPGRPRKARQSDCLPSAAPFRWGSAARKVSIHNACMC